MAVNQRQKKIWVAMGAALAASIVVGLVSAVLIQTGSGHVPTGVILSLLVVLIGGALLACIPWWRRLDDMARDAHMIAWYRGGSFGGGVALLAVATLGGVKSAFFQGGAVVFLAQVAAYVVFWLGWWALRRPAAS